MSDRRGPGKGQLEIVDLPAGDERWAAALPVLRELRGNRTEEEINQVIATATGGSEQGPRFIGAFDMERCLGVSGYRVIINTAVGRVLYVDDLVVSSHERFRGVGASLLAELSARARDEGCATLELDSGVHRFEAHRFYFRHRLHIASHHFRLPL